MLAARYKRIAAEDASSKMKLSNREVERVVLMPPHHESLKKVAALRVRKATDTDDASAGLELTDDAIHRTSGRDAAGRADLELVETA
ncbi:MAG: hypothetical protein HOP29_08325 [Phycisphaerales bacterium]|nr:hypothetical protein [Phycisphaerales bacterium]